MNELFFSLWFIDFIGSLPMNLALGSIIFATAATAASIILERKPKWVLAACATTVVIVVMTAIPSKTTMYLMLGIRTAENVMQSDVGQKVEQLVNQELNKLLNGGKK